MQSVHALLILGYVFSVKAGEYLHEIDETLFRDIAKSGLVGILHGGDGGNQDAACQEAFPACFSANATTVRRHPDSYRHPAPHQCRQNNNYCGKNENFFSQQLHNIIQYL